MAINVSDNNPRINYTATSGQTVFTVPFEFFASTDLTVYVGGSVLATSAYTVTGGSGSTGSITTSSGQTAGAEIAIVRDVPLERTTDLTSSYSASSLNDQLDRIVTQVADLDDRVSRSISLNDYEVGVSLDLPAKASRLGKTVQFNSTTGALEVGPSGTELTSIASIASEITSLNNIKANITTVAGAISNVNSVGSNISSVTSVASSISNVNTVNTNIANVNTVAGSISNLNDVADSLDQVELVGGSISNVDVVGAAITNVNTVAGGISNINTVAGISGNVTTVAGITSAISTVNSNATNINTAATNIANINTVANVITKVTTVSDNIANVNTVAPSVSYLSTIANNIANINTLAPISAHITTVAGVASSVSGAAANAAAAEAAKIAAQAAQAAAELAADNFDDTYLGAKASDPTLDNDGDSLGDGDLYFNTTNNILKVYNNSAWQAAALDASGLVNVTGSTMTGNLLFGDGNEARFGTHGDLTIEHDLNNSNIIAANNKPLNITANGGFNINSDNIYFREHAASNTYMEMRDGGGYDHAVRIFHSGTDVRLETTSTGVNVTGTITSDGLTVDGVASIQPSSASIPSGGNTSADDLIIQSSGHTGMTIGSGTSSTGSIYFADSGSNSIGRIQYNHTDNSLYLQTNAEKRLNISSGGDISFYEDTGTTAKFFWDASAESLGIGTSSPTAYGNSQATLVIEDDGNPAIALSDTGQTRDWFIVALGDGLGVRYADGGGSGSASNVTESAFFKNNGSVGIGTSSPAAELDVVGATAGSGTAETIFRLSQPASTIGAHNEIRSGVTSGTDPYLAFAIREGASPFNTVERMRIVSSGDIFIGTPSDIAPSNGTNLYISDGTVSRFGLEKTGSNARKFSIGNGGTYLNIYDETADSERLRITSTGSLLVGTADTTIYNDAADEYGFMVEPSGQIQLSANNATMLYLNRQNGDGTIVDFRKDGQPVGIIGVSGNGFYFGDEGDTGFVIDSNADAIIPFNPSSRVVRDNAVDLGSSSGRFKDLYLSGSVKLPNCTLEDQVIKSNTFIFKNGAGTAEYARFDSSGNLLVGTTDSTVANQTGTTQGVRIAGAQNIQVASTGISAYFNKLDTDGDIVEFRKSGATVGSIFSSGGIQIGIGDGDTALLFGDNIDAILPWSASSNAARDDAIDLGRSATRFDDIYATNGTIQTSDRNEKQDIAELSDAEQRVAVAAKGLLRKFRWKDAVVEKGDEARTHFGIIAQDLQAAFAAEGLDAGNYAMFISSTWTDEETGEERTRMGVRYSELLAFIIAAI